MAMVTRVLSYFLTFAFTAAAVSKLYPRHPNYAHMAEKAPSWLSALNLQALLTASQLQTMIGVIELLCAALLPFSTLANYGLMAVMAGAIFTHYRIDGALTKEATPAAFLLALLCLLAVFRSAQSIRPPSEPPLPAPPQQQAPAAAERERQGEKED